MPGYARPTNVSTANEVIFVSSGNIQANNTQEAIEELDDEKAPQSSISGLEDRIENTEMITLKGLL